MGDSVRRLISEGIEWAPHCVCAQSKDVRVDHGRLDVGVAQTLLGQLTSAGSKTTRPYRRREPSQLLCTPAQLLGEGRSEGSETGFPTPSHSRASEGFLRVRRA